MPIDLKQNLLGLLFYGCYNGARVQPQFGKGESIIFPRSLTAWLSATITINLQYCMFHMGEYDQLLQM